MNRYLLLAYVAILVAVIGAFALTGIDLISAGSQLIADVSPN